MLICAFPPHYQLVYINFDISSFSLISYLTIILRVQTNLPCFAKVQMYMPFEK